ncbi:GSCOCT00014324001.2-RA-CDS [Cotesia congregata]|uniref:Cc_bv6.29_11.2 n=2 Tax=root TaxID=1 RepID=S6D321_COTCN|nr:hypothetical protein CcBV_2-11.2 [Bracoviriform congregatae]CAD6244521.1 GSCOCT00014324001.2-RA-CDS [Cotesia congregata]CAG17434.1 hypothetical protein CcBV_2-11.2 [Bracoviriform congregatae]CAG5075268.1 cc_bv6.29_11.2 [Cotesia congregata]CCQ71339.1 hypothetical protein BV6-29 [Cotesia congregata]
MVLEVIVPQEWQVLPEATLRTELLYLITIQETQRATSAFGVYNGVTAKSLEFNGYLWFKKLNDLNEEPDFNIYVLLEIPFIPSSSIQDDDSTCSECDSEQLLSDDEPCSTCDE